MFPVIAWSMLPSGGTFSVRLLLLQCLPVSCVPLNLLIQWQKEDFSGVGDGVALDVRITSAVAFSAASNVSAHCCIRSSGQRIKRVVSAGRCDHSVPSLNIAAAWSP